jgi:hypothetical protein
MYELVDNGVNLQLFGNAFVPELVRSCEIVVDGDLIVTGRLAAPKITVAHGSLICPEIACNDVTAEILGIFDLSKPYVAHPGWRYTWLRPCWSVPTESPSSEASIFRAVFIFQQPEMVSDPAVVKMLMNRVHARPSCLRARVLFAVALEELTAHPTALTPLGRQVAECFLRQPRLPDHWRF